MAGELKVGDKVLITREGYVGYVSSREGAVDVYEKPGQAGEYLGASTWHGVSIEKIEPPIEQFKPGDRLRRRMDGGWKIPFEITVADEGYLQHFADGGVRWYDRPTSFTSALYEKVELG